MTNEHETPSRRPQPSERQGAPTSSGLEPSVPSHPAGGRGAVAGVAGAWGGLKSWFDVDSHACFVLDLSGRVLDANPAAVDLLNTRVATIRGAGVDFGSAEGGEAVSEALDALGRGELQRKRVVLIGQDGVWRSLELHLVRGEMSLIFMTVRTQACTTPVAMEPLIEAFRLTPAQAEVVTWLAAGLVPKEIGRRMGVSTHTVRTHLRAIYGKLRVRGIAGALRLTAQLLD
jgi:DNA-binding CsgD family transcriptional regulator